jgi:hypothetical protein
MSLSTLVQDVVSSLELLGGHECILSWDDFSSSVAARLCLCDSVARRHAADEPARHRVAEANGQVQTMGVLHIGSDEMKLHTASVASLQVGLSCGIGQVFNIVVYNML